MRGYGYEPLFISITAEDDHADAHARFAGLLEEALERIEEIQRSARVDGVTDRPTWPMIVLRSPKGWTVRARSTDSDRRDLALSPGARDRCATNPDHLRVLEEWLRSYRPDELFDDGGRLRRSSPALPRGERRMSANPHANGGLLLRDLVLPDFRRYAVEVKEPGVEVESTRVLGTFLRDVIVPIGTTSCSSARTRRLRTALAMFSP